LRDGWARLGIEHIGGHEFGRLAATLQRRNVLVGRSATGPIPGAPTDSGGHQILAVRTPEARTIGWFYLVSRYRPVNNLFKFFFVF